MADLLPWLNLLLVPTLGLVVRVAGDLAAIKAELRSHQATLDRHERQLELIRARQV